MRHLRHRRPGPLPAHAGPARLLPGLLPADTHARLKADAEPLNVAVLVARYNQEITRRLLRGAEDVLRENGVEDAEVHWVPGALEIPVAALALAERGVDAIVCLACIIGPGAEVPDFIPAECISGLTQVQLETGVPCTSGVLIALDRETALAASGPKNNRGRDAAQAALDMVRVLQTIQGG